MFRAEANPTAPRAGKVPPGGTAPAKCAQWRWIALVALLLWPGSSRAAGPPTPATVYAASSLADVMPLLGRRYAERTGQPAPTFAFASSHALVQQIERGAPADVVVTADASWMDHLQAGDALAEGTRVELGENRLVVVVPAGARTARADASFLEQAAVATVAVAAEPVPAGKRAREALLSAGVDVSDKFVVARNVRAALSLAARDKVDAAIVYRTDAAATSAVATALVFDTTAHAPIRYAAAMTRRGLSGQAGPDFMRFLASDDARSVMATAGFDAPRSSADASPGRAAAPTSDVSAPVWLSLWVAALSLTISVIPAVALGWLLARREFVGKSVVSTVLLTPLVLPPVVVGFGLLELFGRGGALWPLLSWLGAEVAFSQVGAVVAASVVGFPLLVLMSRLAIEAVDVRYEQIAQTLGSTPLQAFVRVTLPMALPGLAAGAVLAYARALGEFGATAVLASDIPGQTRTLALAIYALYEQPGGDAGARQLVFISIGLCAVALVGYEWLGRVQKRRLAA